MRPTRVRYLAVSLATLAAVLLYLHRFCLSFAERYVKEDLRLTNDQMAWLLAAFFLSYALAQVPAGWLSDRFGARLMLAGYILVWSLCTGLMGMAMSFSVILILRLGCGLGQAGAFPTSAALLSRWVPFSRRGLASGIVSYGGRLGGAIAPVLTAYLIVAFVPAEAPSLLQPGDLLDAAALCARLRHPDDPSTAQLGPRVLEWLPPATVQGIRDGGVAPEDTLLAGLNEALSQRNLPSGIPLNTLPLPREALALAKLPPEQLTEQESTRFNRLLLEAAYPEAIRKLYAQGWRPVVVLYGALGLFVAALFWLTFRNRPEEHPSCNAAEVELIQEGIRLSRRPVGVLPLGPILRSRSLWLISLAQFGTNFGWTFLLTWWARYLAEVPKVPVLERGWLAGLPLFVGMFGQLLGGWLTDRLVRRLGLRWGRCLPMSLSRFVAVAAFLLCLVLRSPWSMTAALAVVALATDLGTPASWAYNQDVGGRYVGAVLGWGNMWGNFGAFLSPLVLNYLQALWGWNAVFLACAGAFQFAGILALGVDATVPVFPVEKPEG